MKKILAVAVAFALILTMIIPSVAFAAVDYSYIRVRLDSMQKQTSIQFKVAGAYRIAESSGVDLYPKITYTLKTYGTGMRLTYNNGKGNVTVTLPAKVTFVQYTNGSGSNFFYLKNTTSGWRNYAGNMTFKHIKTMSSDYIELVNTVFVETYLYGVVSSEMANDWPLEALKAQAVAARTYAMAYIKSRQNNDSMNYDVVDTSSNQVYRGYPLTSSGAAQANIINAVNATRGKVILVGDTSLVNFADGMYSASNGGQIRTITMRYGSGTNTYHVFKDDPYDLGNANSPKFAFIFPKTTAALNALGTADRNKANTMIDLIKDKVVAALAAQGVTCAKSSVTVNAIKGATPTSLKPGMPAGSKEYTSVSVTVNVTLAGVSVPAPVASVTGNGAAIASGSTTPSTANDTDFGAASIAGATVQKIYTITNTGNAALTISGITLAGDSAADFTVGALSSATIAAGGAATFAVTFDPSAPGERATTVSIISDAAASPYLFRVKGAGQSNGCSITAFGFEGYGSYLGTITDTAITVHLPDTADVTNLTAIFFADAGATVVAAQTSGTTVNDFTNPRMYTVTAEDGTTKQYTVTVVADVAVPEPAPGGDARPDGAPEGAATPRAGGGGMPANTTMDITVTLKYISQAAGGSWDVLGELRTKFASYYSLLNGTNLWLLYASSDSNCYYVTARGYGHGVGLSQRGAQEMAKANKTYQDILDFYYNMNAGKSTLSTISITQRALSQIPGKGSSASYYKVNTGKLQLRAAASTKGTVLYTLTSGTIIEVLSTSSGWSRVLYGSKGLVGYVSAKYLKKTTQTPPPVTTAAATPTPSATTSGTAAATASPTPTPAAPLLIGRVTATSLYIRASASTSAAIVYDHLNKGDSVVILDRNAAANWYKVKYASYTGYAMSQSSGGTAYFEIIGTTPTATPTATSGSTELTPVTAKANVTDYLTIRASASTSASKLGQIPANATFTVLQVATTANWLKVKYSGTTGYVLAKYATIGGNSGYHACTVTVSALNARSGAGTGNSIVTTLDSGDTLVVTATTTVSSVKWYKVKVGSVTAYVDSRYVRINTTT